MFEVGKTNEERRADVLDLEAQIKQLPQLDPLAGLLHHFAPGLYGRELNMKAGTCIVGKIHRHAHLNVIMSGRVSVVTEFGREEFEGPVIFKSEPGIKRAVYNHTDVRWITFHPTDETDLGKIEEEVIAPSYDNLLEDL